MTPLERTRRQKIARALSWGVVVLVPFNLAIAADEWLGGRYALSGLSLTLALYSAWNSRQFIRSQLLRLALWYVAKEVKRRFNCELGGFQWTTPDAVQKHTNKEDRPSE